MPTCKVFLSLTVRASDWKTICLKDKEVLKSIPKSPGVYILHSGRLADAWPNELTFYIGGTYKEGLRARAQKHRSVLLSEKSKDGQKEKIASVRAMREYRSRVDVQSGNVFFSYYQCCEDVKPYVPFAAEAELLGLYAQKNNQRLPFCNFGRR